MPHLPRVAILTSHGQPSAPPPPEIHLAAVAAAVNDQLPDWDVRSATLSSKGFLEAAMCEDAVIYPFFMARGWFTGKVLPRRLTGWRYRIAAPFGLDPALPALTVTAIRDAVASRDWALDDTEILLAAHGSARGPKAAEAAESFAATLRADLPGLNLRTGFVEETPFIADAARSLGPRALCLPFFAQSGAHVREDIPEALAQAGFQGATLPVLGALPGVPELIAKAILRTHHQSATAQS
ncbi:cobalamin biosynthesis protein CbiX [Epibacterium sp. MM17-32]|uniref:CbiX/SirB N-terminal domain-containing protein n=1 Tax=Epibacterium sp. MM17-32 TaxID=2917734 RepID=UPI001EF695AF|nr:CbiX/SirB N-terminal domain-containing protein [Epibacterium sp. MM17-32]MCG7627497.1 cobalamin biosynthesis protein CbiX [Epibacterium sp. MM17-32]